MPWMQALRNGQPQVPVRSLTMVSRRDVVTGGVLGAVSTAVLGQAGKREGDKPDGVELIVESLREIRQQLAIVGGILDESLRRMAILFMFTQLVLRPDAEAGFVGVPYDRG